MEKAIRLASVLLKCSLGSGKTDNTHKLSAKRTLNFLMVIVLVPIVVFLFQAGVSGQAIFSAMDGEEIVLRSILFVASFIIFFIGIFSCINTFYLSSNLETLLVMPFTSSQITGAKFIVAAFYEYYISLVAIAPLLIGFGYGAKASFLYWIGTIFTVLLLPILPLTYSAIIAMLIMRVLGQAKNKQRMATLGAFGVVFGGMLFTTVSTYLQHMQTATMKNTVEHMIQAAKNMVWFFPNIPFFVDCMHGQKPLSLLFALLVTLASVLIFLGAAKLLYLAGAVGMQETSSSHKALNSTQMDKLSKQKGIITSYTIKELKMILRTPAYYINCLLFTLGWPVVMIIPQLVNKSTNLSGDILASLSAHTTEPLTLFFILLWTILLINSFSTMLNGIAHSAISREGHNFSIMKQLPIAYAYQLKAKRNAAFVICGIGGVLYTAIGILYFILSKGFPLWTLPVAIVLSSCIVFILVDLQLFTGMLKPRLDWDNEAIALKMAGWIIPFLITMFGSMVFILLEWNPLSSLTLSPWIVICGILLLLILLAFLLDRLVLTYGVKKLEKM